MLNLTLNKLRYIPKKQKKKKEKKKKRKRNIDGYMYV